MSYLDNSGDILLDAVLTDTGRFRLAKGNGSFKIAKFAFGDDEINYGLYEKNHASGSAYHDLKILQTPILEAFSNNASTMHSKLISIPKTNLLFMPVMKMNVDLAPQNANPGYEGLHLICCTVATEETLLGTAGLGAGGSTLAQGVLRGVTPGTETPEAVGTFIQIDQGLDTTKISQAFAIDPDLKETAYIVELDYRLGRIKRKISPSIAPINFIDDDNIATYYLSKAYSGGTAGNATYYVGDLPALAAVKIPAGGTTYEATKIQGPLGTYVRFKVAVSVSLNTSNHLFDTLGGGKVGAAVNAITPLYIDSVIKITGATTGYSVDIPVRFIKQN